MKAKTLQSGTTMYHRVTGLEGFRSTNRFASAGGPSKTTAKCPKLKIGPTIPRLRTEPYVANRTISVTNRPKTRYDVGLKSVLIHRNRDAALSNKALYSAVIAKAAGIENAIPNSSIPGTTLTLSSGEDSEMNNLPCRSSAQRDYFAANDFTSSYKKTSPS